MSIKVFPNIPRAYIDLDGPVADFVGMMDKLQMPGEVLKMKPGIYEELDVVQGAVMGVKLLARIGYQPWILSKAPDGNFTAAAEKLKWLNARFPIFEERVIITPDKGCVGCQSDILIEDHPEWANAAAFKGMLIEFDSTKPKEAWWNAVAVSMIMAQFRNTHTFVYNLATSDISPEQMSTVFPRELLPKPCGNDCNCLSLGMTDSETAYWRREGRIPGTVWSDVIELRMIADKLPTKLHPKPLPECN